MYFLYTQLIFFSYYIALGTSISIRGLIINSQTNSPLLTLYNQEQKAGVRSEGIFERFVRTLLDVLSTGLTGNQLIKYCRMLAKELKNMEFTYTEKLARRVRRLARMYGDDLIDEMKQYRREFDEKLPKRTQFLSAMNEVFTLQQNLQFDDYIHGLDDYAHGFKLEKEIEIETKKLLNDVIVNNIDKISQRDQRILEKKLSAAIKEYNY